MARRRAPRASAAAVALVAGAAAWGRPAAASTPPGISTAAHATALTVGTLAYPPTFDPTASADPAVSGIFDGNVFEHLLQLAPDGSIVPMLATGYRVSADHRRYVFALRTGVRFSNGDRLSAADVVFSLQRAANPASKYPAAALLAGVRSVRALGPSRVAVTLKTADWQLPYDLAATADGIVLDPPTVGRLGTDPIGTGPFVYRSSIPGSGITLERNRHYWGAKPRLTQVRFRLFPTADAENAALLAGDIDMVADEPALGRLASFKADPSLQVRTASGSGKVQLSINNASGPLSIVTVRQAISYALDRDAIDKTAAAGIGVKIGTDSVPGDPYYLNLSGEYPYDPARAKQLLAEAGYPGGFTTSLLLPPFPFAQLAGPLIAAELGQVGIKVTVTTVDAATWTTQVIGQGNFALTLNEDTAGRDLAAYADASQYWHYAGSDELQTLLDAANAATTTGGWIAGCQQALRTIAGDAVNVWLYARPEVVVARTGLTGVTSPGLGDFLPLAGIAAG